MIPQNHFHLPTYANVCDMTKVPSKEKLALLSGRRRDVHRVIGRVAHPNCFLLITQAVGAGSLRDVRRVRLRDCVRHLLQIWPVIENVFSC
jgi:hypothetical protein